MNTTEKGIPCQEWFTDSPHSHPQSPPEDIFPEMTNADNFCRNPGGTESRPWCYTADPAVRWQHCSLLPCDNKTGGPGGHSGSYSVEVEVYENPQDYMQVMSRITSTG